MKAPAYPAYKPSGVEWLGDIPEDWDLGKFSREVYVKEGQVDPSIEPYDAMLLVAPNHVESGTGRLLATETALEQGAISGKYLCKAGDVIYSKIRPALAKVVIAPEDCLCSADMYPLRATNQINNRYLYWLLLSQPFTAWSVLEADRVAMPKINRESLSNFWLTVPPLGDQCAVAAFLNAETAKLDALIEKKRALIDLLKEQRSALISRTVTRGMPPDAARAAGVNPHPPMRDSGIEWLGEIPEHWVAVQLRRHMLFITSGSRGWAEHYSDDGSIFVRIGNLTRDSLRIDLSDVQRVNPPAGTEGERTRICVHDVLFSITAYLGSVAVATQEIEGAFISQHIALVRLDRALGGRFVGYSALSHLGQMQLNEQAYGGTKLQLGLDDVRALWVAKPPTSEQSLIADYLDEETAKIDQMAAKVEEAIERLREYRSALITAAVTGKIDVRQAIA